MHTSGQMLELLLHMQHVLLDGMEGRFRPHFIRPPHMDSTDRQAGTQTGLQTSTWNLLEF